MPARAPAGGEPGGAADFDAGNAASLSHPIAVTQPREIHDPLPDDKVIWFAVPAVHRLRGRWQGPGIEAFLPPGALEVAKIAEESERAALRQWADLIEGDAP
jgi:hypothetical protein